MPLGGERRRGPARELGLGRCERGSIFRERFESLLLLLLSPSASLVDDDARPEVRVVTGASAPLVAPRPETVRADSSATARRSLSS